jgi:hypothetical protein
MNIGAIFNSFVMTLEGNLAARERDGKNFKGVSENTIRFFMAAAFLQQAINASVIELDAHHPYLPPEKWADIDIYVRHPGAPVSVGVRFDKTDSDAHIGDLLNDIFCLALLREGRSLMLYVAETKMIERLKKRDPRFLKSDSFLLDAELFERLPKTAKKGVKDEVLKKLDPRMASLSLLDYHEGEPLACLLYEVSVQPPWFGY